MNVKERIWMLDKSEASLLRSYFTNISTCHEEIDTIVAKNWNVVKKGRALSHSIIRRMIAFYRYSKEYSERMERALGVEAGTYFEDIIFSPLKALLEEKFGDRFKVNRKMRIPLTKEKSMIPDLAVLDSKEPTNNPICLIECKTWLNRYDFREQTKPRYDFCSKSNILFFCIAGTVAGEDLKTEAENIVFWLTEQYFPDITSEYGITIIYPIEDVFEKILSKCGSLTS